MKGGIGLFYYKKIITYLEYFESGNKVSGAGHIKMEINDKNCHVTICLKKIPVIIQTSVLIYGTGQEILLDKMYIKSGQGTYEANWNIENINNTGVSIFELTGLFLRISMDQYAIARWDKNQLERPVIVEKQSYMEENRQNEEPKQAEQIPSIVKQDIRVVKDSACLYYNDKWEQLTHTYPVINPFSGGNDATHLSIAPSDFVVLRQDYQKMVNNSFLLHGYYNYRHILLSRYQEKRGTIYYIGVPGTYYEREKMVAAMFGFEGFEIAQNIKEKNQNIQDGIIIPNGTFGYYMKEVLL